MTAGELFARQGIVTVPEELLARKPEWVGALFSRAFPIGVWKSKDMGVLIYRCVSAAFDALEDGAGVPAYRVRFDESGDAGGVRVAVSFSRVEGKEGAEK